VFEGKHREWAIHWRSIIKEFGLGGSPPAPTMKMGNNIASIVSLCHLHSILDSKKKETGEIVLLSEKVLLIVVGSMAVVLAIAALVMWVF
jgi:hypothetical protein